MHITVQLERATLEQLLAELLPITISLDDDKGVRGRSITIHPVRHLDVVGGGIRLITAGQLRWVVGFLPITVTVERLVLALRPVVVGSGVTSRLLFRPVIEDADVKNVPALLDQAMVGLVNRALARRSEQGLAWDFGRTLALRFLLPDSLVPLEAATVKVEAAQLRVQSDIFELAVTLSMHITRAASNGAAAPPAA
jgi:hypothetical protein